MNTQQVLDTLVQEEIDKDNDFQSSLSSLSDEDKEKQIGERKVELFKEHAEEGLKQKELASNYKIRAEKAEEELKPFKKQPELQVQKESELSLKDLYAFTEAKVHPDDVDEVIKASKLLGKSPVEVLKDPIVIARLETLSEQRKSALATAMGKTKTPIKPAEDSVMKGLYQEDKIPEPGSEAAEMIFWARKGMKKPK